MRHALPCFLLVTVLAASGCMGHGCEPAGGRVAWRQPGAFAQVTDPAFDVSGVEVHPGETPQGYELPAGHPIYARFGDKVRIVQTTAAAGDGGASVDWSGNGGHLVHYGGERGGATDGVFALVDALAASPEDAADWKRRHAGELQGGETSAAGTVRTVPIPLDLPLDVGRAFNATAGVEAATLEGEARLEIVGEGLIWTVTPENVRVSRDTAYLQVLGGDWVVADLLENPEDLDDALARGRAVATQVGLDDGPQLDGHFREQLMCG